MDDYLRSLPGVNFQDRGAGQNTVVIRGISSDSQFADSTAGVYLGETPITDLGSNANGSFSGNADIKLVDVKRIEVLRGPQGTLYGAGSMGGTVRVLPEKPNLGQVEGKIKARYSQTGELGGNNSMVQGIINLPLIDDQLAIRAVAYQFDNSGYIENTAGDSGNLTPVLAAAVGLGAVAETIADIGSDEYTGFRITTLWQPSENLEITAAYTQQDITQEGFPQVNLGLSGEYEQIRLRTGIEGSDKESLGNEIDIVSLTFDYDFAWGNIVSASSKIDYQADTEFDLSFLVGFPWDASNTLDTEVFIQEIRFTSQFDGPLQFLAGVYYEDRDKQTFSDSSWSGDPLLEAGVADFWATLLGAPPPSGASTWDTVNVVQAGFEKVEQKAFFSEISYSFSDKLTATVGMRYFEYDQDELKGIDASIFGAASEDTLENKDNGSNYKLNLTYTPNEDLLLYGQWAEGFRLGGPQTASDILDCDSNDNGLQELGNGIEASVPDKVSSDDLESYELGLKASLADSRVTVNASIYRINWDGIPVSIFAPCGSLFTLNAAGSKSEGVEIETQIKLAESFQVDISASYGEATLTEDAVNLGSKGDNLPGSADFNFTMGLEHQFNVKGNDAYVRADYSYISEYHHDLAETGEASGGYGQLNLKTGISFENFDIDLFVNNLTNVNEFTWVETTFATSANRAYRVRPRTMGLNFGYQF